MDKSDDVFSPFVQFFFNLSKLNVFLFLRSILRYLSHMAQVTGHILLYTGTYVLQLTGDYEEDRLTNGKR